MYSICWKLACKHHTHFRSMDENKNNVTRISFFKEINTASGEKNLLTWKLSGLWAAKVKLSSLIV